MSSIIDGYYPYLQHIANNFIIFTPFFSYGSTCYSIHRRQTSDGFSIDICATMLFALILRICYYAFLPYDIALFIQLCVMIFIQCVLLKVSLYYRLKDRGSEYLHAYPNFHDEFETSRMATENLYLASDVDDDHHYQDLVFKHLRLTLNFVQLLFKHIVNVFDGYYRRPGLFWQWDEESKYWSFLWKFAAFFGTITAIFHDNERFGSFIGILGLFIEALLPLPQILLLNRFQSVKNFKVILLLSWLGGDCTKITYLLYGTTNISIIFIVAALFQMSLDIFIAFQYFHYKKLEFLEDTNIV